MINATQHEDRKNNPWLGLVPYEENDALLFCGRSREADELTHIIIEGPQTTIYGPSGVGKTSLLRAGVFPRLEERHFLPVYIRLDHSEDAPDCATQALQSLIEELAHRGVDIEPLAERVAPDLPETPWEFLHRHEFWNARNHLLKPVLVFDQFEEMFTLAGASRAKKFITELGDLCGNSPPRALDEFLTASGRRLGYSVETQNYRVVLCLREDFLARLEELIEPIPSLRRNRFSLQAMSSDQAIEAVLGPGGELVNETVARRIVEAVTAAREPRESTALSSAGAPNVEPALLSLFCRELNNRRLARNQACLTIDLVEESRRDILRDFYRRALDSVSTETAAFIEEHLLTTSGYRNAVAVDDVTAAGIPLAEIEELAHGRLLRFEERKGLRWVEFSHDVLTAMARESRDTRRNEQVLRKERERTEALERVAVRERRRVRLALGAVAALVSLVVALVGTFYYLFFMKHVAYYHTFAKCHGFPIGVVKLTKEAVSHRQWSFKLVRRGLYTLDLEWRGWGKIPFRPQPVERVIAVNRFDNLTENHNVGTYLWSAFESHAGDDQSQTVFSEQEGKVPGKVSVEELAKVCQWEFVSGEEGRPVYEVGRDRDVNMVWGVVYAPRSNWKEEVCVHFVGTNGYPQRQRKDAAEYLRIQYDDNGFEWLIEYRDQFGQRVPGVDGAHAKEYSYDSNGQMFMMASCRWDAESKQYKYMIDHAGNTGIQISYNEHGYAEKIVSFGPDKTPKAVLNGWAIAKIQYDEWGNITEQRYYGIDGSPCLHKDGNHGWTTKYDERGNEIEVTYLGLDGQPATLQNGYAIARRAYNERGKMIEEAYFDAKGKPTIDTSSGIQKLLCGYDERGNMIEQRYYGIDGSPCLHKDGNHGWAKRYDERGNVLEVTFLGLDGQPAALENGYAIVRRAYDERGNEIEWACFNVDGSPCLYNDGYASVSKAYNERGKVIEWACFDVEGKPAIDKTDGTHKTISGYDGRGNMIEQRYYGIDGNPCLHKDGYAIVQKKYNALGKPVEEWYFDANEKPTENNNGVHYGTVKYDDAGRMTELAAYDLDGNLTPFEGDKIAIKRWRYDARGNESEVVTIGIDRKPVANDDGYAIVRKAYDERGNMIEQRNYGIDGSPCLDKNGNHGWTTKYDERGNEIEVTFFGLDSQPAVLQDGYAIVRKKYNALGKPVEERYFDANGKPTENNNGVHYGTLKYDNTGRMTELAAYDLDGNLTLFEGDKIAMKRWRYDVRGNESEVVTIGIDREPVANNDGYAIVRREYDERGKMIEERYYGPDADPCLHENGYHGWQKTFDKDGNEVETVWFDTSGAPMVSIVVVAEVFLGSAAERQGIKKGDIILEYGQWSWQEIENDPEFKTLITELERCKNKTKRVVVYRDEKVFAFEFPAGLIGVRMVDRVVSARRFEQIRRAQETYQKGRQP